MIKTFQTFMQEKEKAIAENYFGSCGSFLSLLPDIGLSIPYVEKQGKIKEIEDFSNPISIQLSDGSKLFFTTDEYRRLHTKPKLGQTMIVRFQRLKNDTSSIPSKIIYCKII